MKVTALWRKVLCEFVCMFCFIFLGLCTNAQTSLTHSKKGDWLAMTISWAIALVLNLHLGWNISGSHINPAISLFCYTMGGITFVQFLLYAIAQTFGAFCGAALAYLEYHEAINHYGNGVLSVFGENSTAGIFATYPAEYVTILGGCIDQIIGAMVFLFFIGLITDRRSGIPSWLQPSCIGAVLVLIGIALGVNCGYAINPARDLGPRLFTLVAGYGIQTFSHRNYVWWIVPVIGPLIGAQLGGWAFQIYKRTIGTMDIEGKSKNKLDLESSSPSPLE